MISLIKLPIQSYSTDGPPIRILELSHFHDAFNVLSGSAKKIIAAFYFDKLIEMDGTIDIGKLCFFF